MTALALQTVITKQRVCYSGYRNDPPEDLGSEKDRVRVIVR